MSAEKLIDVTDKASLDGETALIAIAQQLSRIADVLEQTAIYRDGQIVGISVYVSGGEIETSSGRS